MTTPNQWSLEETTAPTWEPLTIDEVKDHGVIFESDDDAKIDALIVAARMAAEARTSLALSTRTMKLRLDRWPTEKLRIYLPYPPLQSVSSITYIDVNGASQTLATTEYDVFGGRTTPDRHAGTGFVIPAFGKSWPTLRDKAEAVTITYVAGWKSRGAIPEPIRKAMLGLVQNAFEHRSTVIVGTIVAHLPDIDTDLAGEQCHLEYCYA